MIVEDGMPEVVLSIYKDDYVYEGSEDKRVKDGTRRNQRSAIKKQLENNELDFKYVSSMINFCEKVLRNEKPLQDKIDKQESKIQHLSKMKLKHEEQIEDLENQLKGNKQWNEYQLKEEVDKMKPVIKEEIKIEYEDTIRRQRKTIQVQLDKLNSKQRQLDDCISRPSWEKYNEMETQLNELINSLPALRKSESLSSIDSVESDSKYKMKYKKLKLKYEKLELENFKLKQSSSSGDTSSSESEDD